MDPNLIARILQMARMRQMQGQAQGPNLMAGLPQPGMGMQGGGMPGPGGSVGTPGPSPMRGFMGAPPGQDMPLGIGTGQAPQGMDMGGQYGGAPGGMTGRPAGINPAFLPNPQAEQALATAGQGSAPMNPIIRQLMQHLGMLNMLRNRSAQPFMAMQQDQGY